MDYGVILKVIDKDLCAYSGRDGARACSHPRPSAWMARRGARGGGSQISGWRDQRARRSAPLCRDPRLG
jgi:hypothetical protein